MSLLRMYIIRYGAKYMEAFESDLYYDCQTVGKMNVGDSLFWIVSGTHTYLLSAKGLIDWGVDGTFGTRFNFRIDCMKDKYGDPVYAMTRVGKWEIEESVKKEG